MKTSRSLARICRVSSVLLVPGIAAGGSVGGGAARSLQTREVVVGRARRQQTQTGAQMSQL
jgi:hypothetical protein